MCESGAKQVANGDTLTATKVAGRNTMVNAAIVFIASLSRLVSKAILLEASAMAIFVRLSFCAIRLATLLRYQ